MGLATHLGPWLLGTVKNTSGTNPALGQVRNIGATVAVQSKAIKATDLKAGGAATSGLNTLCILPAGSQIVKITALTTVQFDGTTATAKLFIGNTSISAVFNLFVSGASDADIPPQGNVAATQKWANVGPQDVAVTYNIISTTDSTVGECVIVIQYVVRNADGTYAPSFVQA